MLQSILRGYDSHRAYPIGGTESGSYQSLDPVQPPIAPPYKTALEMKKASSHGVISRLSLGS
jgi:tRNA (cytidine32/guanosine34-2'-O)-methyltransferase